MIICSNCGATNNEAAGHICRKCGALLPISNKPHRIRVQTEKLNGKEKGVRDKNSDSISRKSELQEIPVPESHVEKFDEKQPKDRPIETQVVTTHMEPEPRKEILQESL